MPLPDDLSTDRGNLHLTFYSDSTRISSTPQEAQQPQHQAFGSNTNPRSIAAFQPKFQPPHPSAFDDDRFSGPSSRSSPHQFPGLPQIGLVVYIVNIMLFALITSKLVGRFFLVAGSFSRSITHPREGFFFPTFFLSVATFITSTQRYGVDGIGNSPSHGPGPLWAMQAAFWAYVVVTTVLAIGQYSFVFATHSFELHTMMPTWILPIFPITLSGTVASRLGVAVAMMMYPHMVGRLMKSGLPNREHRPGQFILVHDIMYPGRDEDVEDH
ncbi:voltage-dependent anion channel-domain-containing protein [Lasiosphaeria ovina]|uniref:Voltage-dependent anion channel-domain-containing protein n=1 Tax=Lasiosphaeria ovina TaxID=92902 RepID=A0AAE0K531_9PEZI|nr:voltage-dependent anion channel-domain-containing protein [Lasiosphaeria ovina]